MEGFDEWYRCGFVGELIAFDLDQRAVGQGGVENTAVAMVVQSVGRGAQYADWKHNLGEVEVHFELREDERTEA